MRLALPALMLLGGCPACFVAGTAIATPNGDRPIEELSVGDVVLAFDTDTRSVVQARVTALHRRTASRVGTLVAGQDVVAGVTEEHPFYDPEGGGWRPARDLVAGDPVVRLVGERTVPTVLTRVHWQDVAVAVYNLTVEGPQTYFAAGFLVHNKTILQAGPCETADLSEVGIAGFGEGLELLPLASIQLAASSCSMQPEVVSSGFDRIRLTGQGDCLEAHTWTIEPAIVEDGVVADVEWTAPWDPDPRPFAAEPVELFELLPDRTPTLTPLEPSEWTAANGWFRLPELLGPLGLCDSELDG